MKALALAPLMAAVGVFASASSACAASAYSACLHTSETAACIASRVASEAPVRRWSEQIFDLVRAGDPASTAAYLDRVRPFSDLIRETRINPSAADLDAIAAIDPQAAADFRPHANQTDWRSWSEAHAGVYAARPMPPAARAGLLLATAAYRTADPFSDPLVISAMPSAASQTKLAVELAMRSISGVGSHDERSFDVAPPGARAVLAHASLVETQDGPYWLEVAAYAVWLGDDAAAAAALRRLPASLPQAQTAREAAQLWATVGQPAEAELRLTEAAAEGEQASLMVQVARAWLQRGDKARAAALAGRALADADIAPEQRILAIQLLASAGAADRAGSAAQALTAEAEQAEEASRSLALAAASEAQSAAGNSSQACALAHRSMSEAAASAAAQLERWSGRYHAEAPLNVWLGRDFTDTGVSLADLRETYRQRGARALARCSQLRGAGFVDDVATPDPNASAAVRLREAADLAALQPGSALPLLTAARAHRQLDDRLGQTLWISALAAVEAVAGDVSGARASYASAVRSLDVLSNPDDQRAAAMALARDGRLLELRLSGGLQPAKPAARGDLSGPGPDR